MTRYTTIVIWMPEDDSGKTAVRTALDLLQPYQTGMSYEDEMSILECIENHGDFSDHIAEDARAETDRLHAGSPACPFQGD